MSGSPEQFDPYWHWLGIDPAARPVHHYSLLGLPLFEGDPAKISAAADERMRLIRQYQAGPRGMFTQKLLNELARAKICLLNPVSKPAYDQALHQLLYPPPPSPSATALPPKPKRKLEEIMPPGWDPASLPAPAISAPAVYQSNSTLPSEQPTGTAGPRQAMSPFAFVAGLGGLILLVGVLGGLLVWRLNRQEVAGDFDINMPQQPELAAENVPGTPGKEPGTPGKEPPPKPAPPQPAVEEPSPEAVVVLQEGSGELNLTPSTALVEGDLVREVVGTGEVLAKWSSPKDIAEWQYKLVKPGFFELELQYISHPNLAGKLVKIDWGGDSKSFRLRSAESDGGTIRDSHIIVVKRGGQHALTFRPAEAWPADSFRLISIRLIPATGQ